MESTSPTSNNLTPTAPTPEPSQKPSKKTFVTSLMAAARTPSFKEDTYFVFHLKPSERKALKELKDKLVSTHGPYSMWGIPRFPIPLQNPVLLKFLHARDFRVHDSLSMLLKCLIWRKEFRADVVLEEDLGFKELEGSLAYMHGIHKDAHHVCYNAYRVFEDREMYEKFFGNYEKLKKFLRWRVQAAGKMKYSSFDKDSSFSKAKIDMVQPLSTYPKGLYMLSNLDQIVPYIIEVIMAYKIKTSYEDDVSKILKESLGKVLEEYYPLVGRVKVGSDGKMVVDFDGGEGGVPFGEAFIDEEMAVAVANITLIDRKVARKLVYCNPKPYETILDVPPLTIQVTRYRCGGMILGVRFNHVMFDGIGFADFMKSWSEIARGFPLSIRPQLERSILSPRKPPRISFPHPEFMEGPLTPILIPNPLLVTKSFCFTPIMFSRLRELAMQNDNNVNKPVSRAPTNFELISALAWKCCTKAKKMGPEETSQICTAIDGRCKGQPPMPKGYFGNCITWSCAQSRAQDLTSRPLSYALGIVQDTINKLTEDHVRSTIDFHEVTKKPLGMVNTMYITKWSRLPCYEIDFGWGHALQVAPGAILENLIIFLSHGKDSKDVVISLSLPIDAMDIFQELIIESQWKDN